MKIQRFLPGGRFSNLVRPEGDPRVVSTGPSSLGAADRLARGLGWFSFGLGAVEIAAAGRLARLLGLEGHERLLRFYGVREFGAGMLSLSIEKEWGLVSRVGGDALDLATLLAALFRPGNARRRSVLLALLVVGGVTALDVQAARAVRARHARKGPGSRDTYRDRSGFPGGLEKARGAARDGANPGRAGGEQAA